MQTPPVPPPLDPDGVRTVTVGTLAFALAALVALPLVLAGPLDDHREVLWVAVTGFGLGLVGIAYCVRRRAGLARRRS